MQTTRIYLDHAATTPVEPAVLETMLPYFTQLYGNASATHAEGRTARAAIESARRTIAQLLHCQPAELFFTSGGTEANNTAIKCAVRDWGVRRIVTTPIEHSCVRNSVLSVARHAGIEVVYLRLLPTGRIDTAHLADVLAASTEPTLVSVIHAHNELATLNPLAEIARICQQYNAFLHADTVQSVGHLPLNLHELGVHLASGSAHKLGGMKGVGFLYVHKQKPLRPLIDGGGQERQMRSGTENVAGIVGFAKALELAIKELDTRIAHIQNLRTNFIQYLQQHVPQIGFNGDWQGDYLPTILSVAVPTTMPLATLLFRLDLQGVSASGGAACNSGAVQASPTSTFLQLPPSLQTVRFSFSHRNTLDEMEQAAVHLQKILSN